MDYDDPRLRSSQTSRRSSGTRGSHGSGGKKQGSSRRKGKGKKQHSASATSMEDALEAKMRAKKKKQAGGSAMDDALEEKIRRKNAAAAAASSGASPVRSSQPRARARDREEEKVEEGLSVSDDELEERIRRKNAANAASSAGVASGVPVDEEGAALFTRGGGDVRNRPPPSLSQHQLQVGQSNIDPLRQAELEKQKNKKEVNQRFRDLHETGQWGGLSKWEKGGICLLTVGAIVAAIVLGIQFGSGDKTPEPTQRPTASPTMNPSASPTLAPTDVTYRETTGLEMMQAASPKLTLPVTPEELKGAKARTDATPQEIAAEYVLYDDPMELPARDPRFLERYALVVFYYANGGCAEEWVSSANWMNDADHCLQGEEWHGIVCDLKGRVVEINMAKNYITGKVPEEFGQLLELSTLDLSNNAMDGTIPARALDVPKMFTIQLNNNRFTGEFPFEDIKDGDSILDVLWIQENTGLTGSMTGLEAYCAMGSITLDCDNVDPKPTYPDDSGLTQFEIFCLESVGRSPNEFTCNFDEPDPFVKPEGTGGGSGGMFGAAPTPAICGTPVAGS